MRSLFAALVFAILGGGAALADGPVPERRLALIPDTDFPGNDLGAYFDTTFAACQSICLGDGDCAGFTFNERSLACFPKSQLGDGSPFQGALSARVFDTAPGVLRDVRKRQGELAFLGAYDFQRARTLAEGLAERHRAGPWTPAQLTDAAAQARREGNFMAALRLTGAALTLTDQAELWLDYGAFARVITENDGNLRPEMERTAQKAAINAYLRAQSAALRASAAFDLALALERENRGRDMIVALRLSQAQSPRRDTAAALERALATYGFRVTGAEVEAEGPAPRICAILSEDLVDLGVDYRSYLNLPRADLAVSAEGRRLCVGGVEHGNRYRIVLRAGLPAANGEALRADVELAHYVPDRSASVRFAGQAYVLPRSQGASVPVTTVNTDRLDLRLSQVADRTILRSLQEDMFGGDVEPWQTDLLAREIAAEVWRGTAQVGNRLNQDMTTQLPLQEALAQAPVGLYLLEARVAGGKAPAAHQWFVLSDLGLSTLQGTDGLHVLVRGLGDALAKPGVTVDLVSEGNRVLASAVADRQGHVRFAPGVVRGTGANRPAMVVARDGDDLAFLSLRAAAFDLSDRGVEGRAPAPPVDVFLTTDRGAYRPGEVVHVTALARDGTTLRGLSGAPLLAVLTRADGVEYTRQVLDTAAAGGAVAQLALGGQVPRGTWRLAVYADPNAAALAETTLLVEDFLPERLDMAITLPDVLPPQGGTAGVQVDYLFGAPGADLPISGMLSLRATRSLADWPGYAFGRHDDPFATGGMALGRVTTDARGAATLPLILPQVDTALPLTARLILEATEGSGRPVERRAEAPVARTAPLIGIRPMADTLPQGGRATFDVIALSPDGSLMEMPVTWALNRVERRYQWYLENGRWTWEPLTTRTPLAAGRGTLGASPLRIEADVDWGQYEVSVVRDGGPFLAASEAISAGWYATADTNATPDMLEVSLDKPRYASGETARLRVVPRAPGMALVSVLSNRVIHMETVALTGAAQEIALPVTDDWGSGAYVSVQAIRPVAEAKGRTPVRSLGLAHAALDPGARALNVLLEAPPESDPRAQLRAQLHVPGATGPVYASVAAVDLGILNLTGYTSPDPKGHYFGQRRLGVEMRDLYGRLIDPTVGALGMVRSGGDAGAAMRTDATLPTEAPVTLHSGLIALDAEGRAELSFDIPDFNGTVRLMAVVWSDGGVGQAQADVLVRDPVVAQASLPRFMAPGDQSLLRLELTHVTGPEGRLSLDIEADAGLSLGDFPAGLPIFAGRPARLDIPITAQTPGAQRLRLRMTGPDGTALTKTLTLDVRRTDPVVARTQVRRLASGEALELGADLLAGLTEAQVFLTSGSLARFDAPGLLAGLEHYPYGCTEQVIARAMPLLSLAPLSESLGLADAATARARIDNAIEVVLSRQLSGGGFGLWNSYDSTPWLDALVTDFLAQARAAGHAVPDRAFDRALDNLRNRVNYSGDFNAGGEDLAYALLVLARQGAAAMGDLRYYADVKAGDFGTPFALAQLGAALAAYGDQVRADRLFAQAAERLGVARAEPPLLRADFGTDRRDAAGLIALARAAGSQVVDVDALAQMTRPGAPASTQEALWMLLAASDQPAQALAGLRLGDTPLGGAATRLSQGQIAQTLVNTGQGAKLVSITATGLPEVPQHATANGYRIERFYFDLEGAPVDPSRVAQGARMVAVLKVLPLRAQEARLMVADPLPAGFEIDNPTLLRQGDIRALDWLTLSDAAHHTEFRADRFLAAVDWTNDAPFQLAYMVRAVSSGSFHHPAASVEDMYRPAHRATTDAGRVVVVAD